MIYILYNKLSYTLLSALQQSLIVTAKAAAIDTSNAALNTPPIISLLNSQNTILVSTAYHPSVIRDHNGGNGLQE